MANNNTYLCLDVGEKRIGVASASAMSRLAQPLMTLNHDDNIYQTIGKLIADQGVSRLIVGLPHNINGEDTAQTRYIRQFAEALSSHITNVNIEFQDEAMTSEKAKVELSTRKSSYDKADVDALAATYILQDYLDQHAGVAL